MKNIVICAIVRDEVRYLLEWIAFHLVAGVDGFLIYDNDSKDGTTDLLTALKVHYPIEVVAWPTAANRSPQVNSTTMVSSDFPEVPNLPPLSTQMSFYLRRARAANRSCRHFR